MPGLDRSPSGVTVTKDLQAGGSCAVGLRRSDVVARDCVRRDNAVALRATREVFNDEAALPWTLRDAASLSRMGVCAFAPSVWRLQREGASVLWAGGRAGRCPGAGRGSPESALPGDVLRAGGRNGGARPAARSGSALPVVQPRSRAEGASRWSFGTEAATGVFVRLDGWRQAQGRSLRLDGKGVEITLRNRGPMVRWPGKPRCGRCLVGLSFLPEAAAGVSFVLLAGGRALDLTLARDCLGRWIGRAFCLGSVAAGGRSSGLLFGWRSGGVG